MAQVPHGAALVSAHPLALPLRAPADAPVALCEGGRGYMGGGASSLIPNPKP